MSSIFQTELKRIGELLETLGTLSLLSVTSLYPLELSVYVS